MNRVNVSSVCFNGRITPGVKGKVIYLGIFCILFIFKHISSSILLETLPAPCIPRVVLNYNFILAVTFERILRQSNCDLL